jgi:flagellar basal body-associated protein FliL
LLVVVILASGAAGYYFWHDQQRPTPPPLATPEPRGEAAPQIAAKPAAPGPSAPSESAKSLPTLENSDAMMRDTVVGLVGRKAFEELVYPTQLIRRIVATVDNLPRETASRHVMPVEPVPGAFNVLRTADDVAISAANSARYAPYVRVFEALNSRALVQRYVESYPLFQRAYAELGFPDSNFNERLLEAIDDLLAAPELAGPAKLVQPKVFYHFADPDLDGRSAGQKIMMRMGSENAAKVKSKLREIRAELRR